MNCCDCDHMKWIEDSDRRLIYLCGNADSGAYLGETDASGNCNWEPEDTQEGREQ